MESQLRKQASACGDIVMSKTQASGNGDSEHVTARTDVARVRGSLGRCPRCGKGRMLRAFLKVNDRCDVCGEELPHERADDFPAYVVIFIAGHLLVPAVLYVEIHFAPPYWMDVALWLPMTLILMTIGFLQPTKGAIVALQWGMGMRGFERSKRAWERAHSDAAPTHVDQGPRSVRCIGDFGSERISGPAARCSPFKLDRAWDRERSHLIGFSSMVNSSPELRRADQMAAGVD
jgi:uncharacterized protein (DUF983 family)